MHEEILNYVCPQFSMRWNDESVTQSHFRLIPISTMVSFWKIYKQFKSVWSLNYTTFKGFLMVTEFRRKRAFSINAYHSYIDIELGSGETS